MSSDARPCLLRQRGVTLIELMVVVLIIAMLMAVAVPSYRQYTMRANRAEAQTQLLQIAAGQERFFLQNNTYAADLTAAPPVGLGILQESPSGLYAFSIVVADDDGFTAIATAQSAQAEDTDCEMLAINERGVRYGGPGPAFAANNNPSCW